MISAALRQLDQHSQRRLSLPTDLVTPGVSPGSVDHADELFRPRRDDQSEPLHVAVLNPSPSDLSERDYLVSNRLSTVRDSPFEFLHQSLSWEVGGYLFAINVSSLCQLVGSWIPWGHNMDLALSPTVSPTAL